MKVTTLKNTPVFGGKKHREGFFVRQDGDKYTIGYVHQQSQDVHEVLVSKELHDAFVAEYEKNKEKMEKIFKPD